MYETRLRLRQLKEQFDEVHRKGMEALGARDFDAFGLAIEQERIIIAEQNRLWQAIVDGRDKTHGPTGVK
jgi:hypothetical protein